MSIVRFAVFRENDGAIQRIGVCPSEMMELQADEAGLSVCAVGEDVCDTTHYIVENSAVALPEASQQEIIDAVFNELRSTRDSLLGGCEWTQVSDSPLSAELKAEWASYRQALRDLPQNFPNITSIDEVVWPVPPT